MLSLTFDEIVTAWNGSRRMQSSPESLLLQQAILRSLATGTPVSARQAAAATGLPMETVVACFEQFCACGAEFDKRGRLTGLVLSLTPTPHRFYVNGHELYAWCALDTLFLPGLIGQPAEVASICPTTGVPIRLTITPTGVTSVSPGSSVLSVVVPDVSAVCASSQPGVTGRTACHSMHFFSSREAAAKWLIVQPDVAILTPEQAWQLAYRVWIEPVTRVLTEGN